MELKGISGHKGIARLVPSDGGRMVDEWDNRLTYRFSNEQKSSAVEAVVGIVEIDNQGIWATAINKNGSYHLERLDTAGRLAAGCPKFEVDEQPIWTTLGIIYNSKKSMWVLRDAHVRRIGQELPSESRITPFGLLTISRRALPGRDANITATLRPLPADLYRR